jgi:hypothetical protein
MRSSQAPVRGRFAALPLVSLVSLVSLAALAALVACGPPPKPPPPPMERFNAALCPTVPPEDTSRPLDPNLDGVRADLAVAQRIVKAAADVRLALTFRNTSLSAHTLSLPQSAFTLEGYQLVDHNCAPVLYARPVAAKALAYKGSGPMPLKEGESATIDTSIDGLAPGLELRRGIYAIRLALRFDSNSALVRGRTVQSEWVTFAVKGLGGD